MAIVRQHRRRLAVAILIFAATAAGVVGAGPLMATPPGLQQIAFKVFRDGEPLGRHTVVFRQDARDLHVEIAMDFEVKLAFLTVFRYRHRSHEVWRDGRLVAIDTKTDANGESFRLRGRAVGPSLKIEGSSGSFLAPGDIMPTSYWHRDTVKRTRLLDTQRGRLIDVTAVPAGVETVIMEGSPVNARRYTVSGDLNIDIWYTADGDWAKTKFEARGSKIIYARQNGHAIPLNAANSKSER